MNTKIDYCDCDWCIEYGNLSDEIEELAKSRKIEV